MAMQGILEVSGGLAEKKCAGLTDWGNTVLDLLRVPLYFYFDTSTFPETCIQIFGG